jgi:hypothetical protein
LTIGYPTNSFVDSEGVILFQKSIGWVKRDKAKKIYDLLANEINKHRE